MQLPARAVCSRYNRAATQQSKHGLDWTRQAPVRAQVVHGMPGPLRVPPDSDVFAQQLQRIGALEVQIRLQRNRPPVAEPIKRRLVRGRHSFALGVVIFQLGTGGCDGTCRAEKFPDCQLSLRCNRGSA